jgi:hypothetical protein
MITINGGTRNQRKYAESMTAYVCQKFNINPTVEISFKRMYNDNNYGYVCHLEDNDFEIDVKRSLRMRDMLVTLAHELVHVKQYVEGSLTQTSDVDIDYWDRPSEIEAHGRETGLFIRWCEQENLSQLKWTQANG